MTLLLMLIACSAADPDSTGARWDTATDNRPSTTDPATLTVIDTATAPTGDTGGDPGLCLGDGAASVRVGRGGLLAFQAYQDGDRLGLTTGPEGDLGLHLDLLSEGLDTSSDMNVILRLELRGNDVVEPRQEEYLALVRMQCPLPGPGWVQVFAALPEELQELAADGALSGMDADVALSLIDKHREEDTALLDVAID